MKEIVILGGGTAGWMAANLLAHRWRDREIRITLIESPDIGIIGVGEGSTPQLKRFFETLKIPETAWMPACKATYKLGIRFDQWSSKPGFSSYFHPFPAQTDVHSARPFVEHCMARRQGHDVPAHPDDWFLNTKLALQAKGPVAGENFPFDLQYGYHFDSGLLGQFLGEHARELGVNHVLAKMTDVLRSSNGDISGLLLDDGRSIRGDFFIDSTGFASLLMQKTLGVSFNSFASNLFNDAAVVFPTARDAQIVPETRSIAMRCGWRWRIPLTHRVGNGYVYSSQYCSAEEAEIELREALGLIDEPIEARHLRMRVGQLDKHWDHNCIGVGLSQGFIEPLEATALHLVQETIERWMDALERGDFSAKHRSEFNTAISQRFEGVRDYIVCHYRINSRNDTAYWRDNAANESLSDPLRAVLGAWLRREDLTLTLQQRDMERYYTTLSWHCLLAGYGVFPDADGLKQDTSGRGLNVLEAQRDFLRRCALNYEPMHTLLERLANSDAT